MNFHRISLLYLTHFKAHVRSKQGLLLSLVFPILFIGVFGIAFGNTGGPEIIQLAVVNQDTGIEVNSQLISTQILEIMKEIKHEDGTQYFELQTISFDEGMSQLEKREFSAMLFIPQNFSSTAEAILSSHSNFTTSIQVFGDPSIPNYSITVSVLENIISNYFGWSEGNLISVDSRLIIAEESNFFDMLVPAMMIFGIMNNLGVVATVALGDVKTGILDRLRLSKMKPYEYLIGLIMSQVTVTIVQIPIVIGTALFFGFPLKTQLIYAFVFGIFLAFAATAIGIIFASLINDINTVGGVSGLVSTVLMFLGGAFVPLPNPTLFNIGNHTLRIFDILPSTSALTALRLMLSNNWSFSEVTFEFALCSSISILLLLLSIIIYTKIHLRAK